MDGIEWQYHECAGGVEIGADGWSDPAISGTTTGDISIPSVLGEKPVVSIGAYAFYGCSGLTSVTIPSTVTSIGGNAFKGCESLGTGVVIRDGWVLTVNGECPAVVEIPEGTRGMASGVFSWRDELTSVSIPSSVRSIGDGAFEGCGGLTSVTISEGVTSIGDDAFRDCGSLTSVTIPSSVTSVGFTMDDWEGWDVVCNAFTGTPFWDNLPDGLIVFGSVLVGVRGECPATVKIPNGVKTICPHAFRGCVGMKSVTIPEGVTNIGPGAFKGCVGLTSVTIPSSVQVWEARNDSIDDSVKLDGVFEDCCGLKSVTISSGVKRIGGGAFCGCSGLTSVVIPSSVESIGNYAFWECFCLETATIGKGVRRIGKCAFGFCYSLKSMVIPEGVTSIGANSFRDCYSLKSISISSSVNWSGMDSEESWFADCYNLSSVTIGDGATSFDFEMFGDCCDLTSVTIPASVTDIGDYISEDFENTPFWKNLPEGLIVLGGVLYGVKGECPPEVVIPDGVKTIRKDAFSSCRGLTSVTIPSSVTSIGDCAFRACSGLTSVVIPDGVTSIGNGAFSDCSGLTSVTIPSSVTSIGSRDESRGCGIDDPAFYGTPFWDNLPDGLIVLGSVLCGVKGECPAEVVIPDGVKTIADGEFECCDGLTSVTIPDGVTCIGAGAFSHCEGLTSVTIPTSVTSIGYGAFAHCEKLTAVTIPSSVTSIGKISLYDDSFPFEGTPFWDDLPDGPIVLGSVLCGWRNHEHDGEDDWYQYQYEDACPITVVIPEGVKIIADYAFNEFRNLSSVTIPSSVTSIGSYAFSECSLTSVMIPEGVTSIGERAFYGYGGVMGECLTSVTIPSSVTSIGKGAFGYSLETVRVSSGDVGRVAGLLFESGCEVWNIQFIEDDSPREDDPVVKCVVVWEAAGGTCSVASTSVTAGSVVGVLPVPTRSGYAFEGWFTEGGEKVGPATVVDANVTWYAHWRQLTCDFEAIVGGKSSFNVGLVGYKSTVLPSGLSYDAKKGTISGTAKKAGDYTVTFTKKGAESVRITFSVRKENTPTVECPSLDSTTFTAGVTGAAGGIPIAVDAESGVKSVTQSGLPSGMKVVQDKTTKLWYIQGAPTKSGTFSVKLTLTTAAGAKIVQTYEMTVGEPHVMSVGTFNGFVTSGDDVVGTLQVTTSSDGKISAKVVNARGTFSFGASGWDAVEDDVYGVRLATKKGDTFVFSVDANLGWNERQLAGVFTEAGREAREVYAQRNGYGKLWYFTAEGNEEAGWRFAYTTKAKEAVLTVSLGADGKTSAAGSLPLKSGKLKVSASGYCDVSCVAEGATIADFAPVVTLNKKKRVLSLRTNLWFDRKNDHGMIGNARLVE